VPVIIDVRDLWPDALVELVPRRLRPLAQYVLFPGRRLAQYACLRARAIIAPVDRYVDWGVANAKRTRTNWDRVFPFAYTSAAPLQDAMDAAETFWRSHQVARGQPLFLVCFFGILGRQFDLHTVIEWLSGFAAAQQGQRGYIQEFDDEVAAVAF
jgi:hypothetical protein